MSELLLPYFAFIGIVHGANPSMGWLFGVYYALTRRDFGHLLLAETIITAGHVLSVLAVLGPLFYIFQGVTLPSIAVAAAMLLYVAYRLIRRGRHKYLGLTMNLKKLFMLGFILALLHVGSLPLLSMFCFTNPSNIELVSFFNLVAAHSFGAALGVYGLSTVTYVAGLNLLRKIWVNFELVWLVTLASVAAYLLINTAFMA